MKISLTRLALIGFSTIAICSMSSRWGFMSFIIEPMEPIRRKKFHSSLVVTFFDIIVLFVPLLQLHIPSIIDRSCRKDRIPRAAKKRVDKSSEPNLNLHLPDEIVAEILSWLPVKSIQKLKCVCKLWLSISQDRAFIHQHMMRSTNRIWAVEEGNGHVIRSICQGLILEKKGPNSNYRLRNPSTKRVLDLPDPKVKEEYAMKPCYVSSTKAFKLGFPFANSRLNGNGSFEILSVGVDDEWRTIDFPFACNLASVPQRSINVFGGMYVLAKLPRIESEPHKREIIILEFENEKLWRVDIPKHGLFPNWGNVHLVNWAGKPSLCQRSDGGFLHVWVVEDYKKQRWAQEKVLIDLASARGLCRDYTPYWFYDDGKLDMHCNHEKFLNFDVVSKVVTYYPPMTTSAGRTFHGMSTVMEFKGMKPLPDNSL